MDDRFQVQLERETELRAAAARILAQRGWSLLSIDELVSGGATLLEESAFTNPSAAVLHLYAHVLYRACMGLEGHERQQTAYLELFRYVYDLARHLAGDLSREEREELANHVIAEVFYRLSEAGGARLRPVREPGAFLAVAIQQLRNTVRRWRRDPFTWEEPDEYHPAREADQPEEMAVRQELREHVLGCFSRALHRYPRARLQLMVVWLRHMGGIDYQTISERLHMTVPNIRVLYTRGASKLRKDSEWRALAQEMGLLEHTHVTGRNARGQQS